MNCNTAYTGLQAMALDSEANCILKTTTKLPLLFHFTLRLLFRFSFCNSIGPIQETVNACFLTSLPAIVRSCPSFDLYDHGS